MAFNNDVQNGTSSLVDAVNSDISITKFTTDRERFLSEYTAFAVKTAKSTVEMCRVVHEAKTQLAKYEYLRFLRDIHHSSEDSTIRKYLAIGERYDRLIQHTNLLPSSWTSIYEITQIPSDVFDALVSSGSSMANLKGAQIKLLKDTNKKSADPVKPDDAADSVDVIASTDQTTTDSVPDPVVPDVAVTPETPAVTITAEPTATDAIDDSCDDSAAEFAHAQQATASLLDRVSQKSVSDVTVDEPYEIVIRFNKKPTDDAWWDLLEEIDNIVDKHSFQVQVIEKCPAFAVRDTLESAK